MKRLALFILLAALPAVAFGSQHYIVVTTHPFDQAVQRLPREDFDPAVRAAMRVRPFQVINGFDAELSDDQVKRMLASGEVEDIEPVVERHVMNDSITAGQQTTPWGISAVHAPDVWPVTRGAALNGSGPIHVAVIDTGVDYHSPELQAVYKGGHNFITGSDDPLDDFGHGTHVSGIIAAADDRQGVVGVAPAIDLFALKVLDQCGSGSSANVIHAIDWIVAKKQAIGGNWVANLSLGSDTPSTTEQTAFQNGIAAGIIFCAASGNSFDPTNPSDGLAFPAGYPGVMSVGAIDDTNTVADFSQRGTGLSVVAPGVAVLSTIVSASVSTDDGRVFSSVLPSITTSGGNTLCPTAPQVTSAAVFCGFGKTAADFPASVNGRIALISRGNSQGTGTLSTKAGSTQVTGTGTSFLNDIHAGDSLTVCGQGSLQVSLVSSNTALTLSSQTPATSTASSQNYAVGVTFVTKAKNAKAAGASAVIVYNHDVCGGVATSITPSLTVTSAADVPPFTFISEDDGLSLRNTPNAVLSLGFGLETWQLESGTSMATPHATAVTALAWAVAPNASPSDVQNAVINNATDLGTAGVDTVYGHGLVNALAAAKQLNPAAFGAPATPPPQTGRIPGRRGH